MIDTLKSVGLGFVTITAVFLFFFWPGIVFTKHPDEALAAWLALFAVVLLSFMFGEEVRKALRK